MGDGGTTLTVEFEGRAPGVEDVSASIEPTRECAEGVAMYTDLRENEGIIPDAGGWVTVRLFTMLAATIPGPVATPSGMFVLCENPEGGQAVLTFELGGEPPDDVPYDELDDPPRDVLHLQP